MEGQDAEIDSLHGTVVEFRNGRGLLDSTYLDPKEALEAVG